MGYGTHRLTTLHKTFCHYSFIYFCCLATIVSAQYEWKTGSWSECQLVGCGEGGTQFRPVWCERISKTTSSVTQDGNCQHIPKPDEQRTCFKVCTEHRYQVKWATTSWSDCKLQSMATVCARGLGVRDRNVTCVWKNNGLREEDSVCSSFGQKPDSQQPCELRCPQDCVVSTISDWNSCKSCRYANKTRTRSIIVPPSNGGRECPAFTESIPCGNCSDAYFLHVHPWSNCESFTSIVTEQTYTHPLVGHQRRDIKCINGLGTLANWRNCRDRIDLTFALTDHQPCLIPQDCEFSDWSSWKLVNSSCMDINGQTIVGTMKRERSVLKVPRGSGRPCPILEEITEVQGTASRQCPRTYWKVSEWNRCQPVNGIQQCSTGLQHRTAICMEESQDGQTKPVPDEKCTEERPMTSQTCRADCHWDCTVSLWSQWTECRVTDCEQYARKRRTNQKTGQRYRVRDVLTLPGMGGQPCPHLSETQNCDPEPCYNWNITTGKCILRKSSAGQACGVGVAHRTFACVNKFGFRVSDSLCMELHGRPADTVDCQVSCPNDCVLSDWGKWTDCPDLCQDGHILNPTIKSRRRTVLARPGPGGNGCPPVREMEEVEDCPTVIECATYMWQTDPWDPCVLNNENQPCGRGTQTRQVLCYNSKRQLVSDEKCTQKVKPSNTQNCEVPCPKDCSYTEFSDWSPCSATCWEGRDTVPTKMRQRYILQYPDNGGTTCPELLKEVQQCHDLPLCHGFKWETTEWSLCVLAPTIKKCGTGIKAREVTCKSDNESTHSVDVCLRYVGPMPKLSEPCTVSCEETCTLSNWGSWSTCIPDCSGKRFRSRSLANEDSAPAYCNDQMVYPTYEQETCFCNDLSPVLLGDWSQCILEPLEQSHLIPSHISQHSLRQTRNASNLDSTCGTGKRYKVVACKNHRNTMEISSKCTVAKYKEEVCMIPCPVDCVMSEWSIWTTCPSKCGAGVQERYRHIQRLPSAGGRLCPSLDSTSKDIQTRLCHPECTAYTWNTYEWSMCIPQEGQPCGEGTQTRHVRCLMINANGHTTGIAGDEMCSSLTRPANQRSCTMPCLGECVVSEWTEWTQCKQPCSLHQQQRRTRKVMREATIYTAGSHDCPRLMEYKLCIRGDNCMEYSWELSSWTTCLVNNGLDNCGVGHKERYAICKDHLGGVVNKRFCEKAEGVGQVTEPLVVSCEIPCDVDCLLSDWTPWSSCSKTCGLGENTRERFIVQQFLGNGRPCPTLLKQSKPCFTQGCYTWNVTEWSSCTAQVGVCGHGVQTRVVECLGDDMSPTDSSKCAPDLNILVMQTEKECHVPCPGECVMTEWTQWNQCFVTCDDYRTGYRRGVQSRSRAVLAHANSKNEPCPTRLWESRSCDAQFCTSFSWRTSAWQDIHRHVWCERSDGLIVEGGCPEELQLVSILSCDPPCIAQSICNDTNNCVCDDNYYPRYQGNKLMECTEENSTLSTGAQKTASESGADGPRNIWMYAVVAAATIFCIFVALALYNMSELFRTGPRPRNRDDDEEDHLEPGFQSSTPNHSHLDGINAVDNCSVCNQMPAPPGDGLTPHYGRSTMETICNETVGACMKVLVCSSKHDMHDNSDSSLGAEHVAMETYACVHRTLDSCTPLDKSATITSPPRPGPISKTLALKHSQSDSAISIPTGSVGSTYKNSKKSISASSNYSSVHEPKRFKKFVNADKESASSKLSSRTPETSIQNSESGCSERDSLCIDDKETGNYIESVVGNGSLEFFVQDYFKKIDSLPKSTDYDNVALIHSSDSSDTSKENLLTVPTENEIYLNGTSVEFVPGLNDGDSVFESNNNLHSKHNDLSCNNHMTPDLTNQLQTGSEHFLVNLRSPDNNQEVQLGVDEPNRFPNGEEYKLTYIDEISSEGRKSPKFLVLKGNCNDSVGSCSDLNFSDQSEENSLPENGLQELHIENKRTKPPLIRQKNINEDIEMVQPLLEGSDKDTHLNQHYLSGILETDENDGGNNNLHCINGSYDNLNDQCSSENGVGFRKESTV